MKMQHRTKSAFQLTSPKSSSCEEITMLPKDLTFSHNSSGSYKSTDDLPASVAECFQDSSLIGKLQNSFLLFIGRGSRYKIIKTHGCSFLSLIGPRKKLGESSALLSTEKEELKSVVKTPVKQVNSLPVRPKTTSPSSTTTKIVSQKTNNNSSNSTESKEYKYSYIDKEDHLTHRDEDDILRQYMSLQQLAVARRHCSQLRSIRDSLTGKARPRSKLFFPTKEQEELRNFLMDVGFVQYYVLLNRNGYDFETATHMNAFDLAAVGITEPLHRMALKYELDQVRLPLKPLESIPETIVEWLESLSLPEYIEHFHQNSILCPLAAVGLTKRDLQLMGIYMLGHRKKIVLALSAIGMSFNYGVYAKQENS